MHKERIERLITHLENDVKDEKFDISHWECGFTACAIGHACRIPEFAKAGLHLMHVPYCSTANICLTISNKPEDCHRGWNAVEIFFGLTFKDARWLFHSKEYRDRHGLTGNRHDVVARLKEALRLEQDREQQ